MKGTALAINRARTYMEAVNAQRVSFPLSQSLVRAHGLHPSILLARVFNAIMLKGGSPC